MKKPITAITLLLALALLAGCGTVYRPDPNQPMFAISDGAYDCTPDELVLALREAEASLDLSFIPEEIPLPSETEPDVLGDYRLIILPRRLFLDLGVEDDGRVEDITVRWSGGSQDTDNAVAIMYCLLNMFAREDVEKTRQDLDYAMADRTSFDKTASGSYVSYMYSDKLGNWMEIRPSVESKTQ